MTLKTTMREGGDTNGEVCACFFSSLFIKNTDFQHSAKQY